MQTETTKYDETTLNALLEVNLATASSLDPRAQAHAALGALIRVFRAERAFVFLVNAGSELLEFYAGRNAAAEDLGTPKGFSGTALRTVMLKREPVLALSRVGATVESPSLDPEVIESASAVAHELRTVVAAPLLVRDKFLGVVYLDNRIAHAEFTEDSPRILLALANHIAIAFDAAEFARSEVQRRALEHDMALTAAVQALLLPKDETARFPNVVVSGFYRPATHCGGDWWWCEPCDDGRVLLFLGDVAGHGAASAMIAAAVAGSYHAMRRNQSSASVPELMEVMNDVVLRLSGDRYNMTMAVLEVSAGGHMLRLWNAGAPYIFIQRRNEHIEVIGESGSPLGYPRLLLGQVNATLQSGDRIFACTDGLFEVFHNRRGSSARSQVADLLRRTRHLSSDEARAAFGEKIEKLAPRLQDDVTFVIADAP